MKSNVRTCIGGVTYLVITKQAPRQKNAKVVHSPSSSPCLVEDGNFDVDPQL